MGIGFHLYHIAWTVFIFSILWFGGVYGVMGLFAIAGLFLTFG